MFWEEQGIIILSCDRISGRARSAVRGNEVTKYVSIHGWGGGRIGSMKYEIREYTWMEGRQDTKYEIRNT